MRNLMKIPKTLKLLQECWMSAENRVRGLIAKKYHIHDEVFITRLFYGELYEEFEKKNSSKNFERAFQDDLKKDFQQKGC